MKAERWQQIEQLCQKARELEPNARLEFLKQACGDDEELRQELESLLASDPKAGSFLERPTVETVATGVPEDLARSLVGRQLGWYEILSLLGVGGMGEVYRARDTKLNREIAIKVLPSAFAQDSDRLARFQREARMLASLNHPNIAAIYGLEELDGVRYLVLELVPGETLAQRLERHPLAVREALEICRQMAEALEAAHEKGIIHRDLKPANVKVTPEGKVKVLDFGLAKVVEADLRAGDVSEVSTMIGVTAPGTILGTVAYMSPEQACGKPLDRRTDVWSFGCVLYEALTRKRAFGGKTVPEVLGRILEKEPNWETLPAGVPENVRCLLRRALQKDPRCRLRDLGDARIELEDTIAGRITAPVSPVERARARKRLLAGALAMVLVVAAGSGGLAWHLGRRSVPAPPVTRFTIALPANEIVNPLSASSAVISPDGARVAYVGYLGGRTQLYIRNLDQLQGRPIPGSVGTSGPFFSPDGEWVGFRHSPSRTLKKVALSGGAPVTLCPIETFGGAVWADDDTILFNSQYPGGLLRVPAGGGTPQPVTTLDSKERSHLCPQILPGGQSVLFTVSGEGEDSLNDARIVVQSLETGKRKFVLEGGTCARYSTSGHLVYARAGSLFATPFDLKHLSVTGTPVPVLEGVFMCVATHASHFSLSNNGTLVYAPGVALGERVPVWVNRSGKADPLPLPPRSYLHPRISPDGRQLAIEIEGPTHDFWTYDFGRGTLTRLSLDGVSHWPLWTPDGKRLTFRIWREGGFSMWWMPEDRSGPEERLTTVGSMQSASSWSPDGRVIAFTQISLETGPDVWVLPIDERKPRVFAQTKFAEGSPKFSPDGRWIAYASNESGRNEIYVQAYPGPGPKVQVSAEGGTDPVWRGKGGELYYRNGDYLMAVAVSTHGNFTASKPRVLWQGRYAHGMSSACGAAGTTSSNYDVTPDGQRFLMIKEDESAPDRIHVALNWTEDLKRLTQSKNN